MTLARNTFWLMVSQAVGLLAPLVMVLFLARALGPEGWAPVLAAQALAAWLTLILEYASDISGTRQVARARHARGELPSVVRGVQSAKVLLVPFAAATAVLAWLAVPVLQGHGALVAWALAYAVCRGLNPFWYFQGVERVQMAAAVEALTRALAAVTVVMLVRRPDDAWLVLALQAAWAALSLGVLTAAMARDLPLLAPAVQPGLAALRESWAIFGIRAWGGVYTQASTLLLGFTGAPLVVAAYGGSERIVRATISMLQPLTQAFLPRVSFIQANDPAAAMRFVTRSLAGVGALGVVMGAGLLAGAPVIVQLLFGAGYESAIPVIRALAVLPPLIAINTVLGVYWAIPFGLERTVLGAIVAAALTNLALVWLLVPRWGAMGMCVAVVAAEVMVLAVLGALYLQRRRVA